MAVLTPTRDRPAPADAGMALVQPQATPWVMRSEHPQVRTLPHPRSHLGVLTPRSTIAHGVSGTCIRRLCGPGGEHLDGLRPMVAFFASAVFGLGHVLICRPSRGI